MSKVKKENPAPRAPKPERPPDTRVPPKHTDVPPPSKTCAGCQHNEKPSDASESIWCTFLTTWSCPHAPSCGGKAFNRTVKQYADDKAQRARDGLANLDRLEANDLSKDKK